VVALEIACLSKETKQKYLSIAGVSAKKIAEGLESINIDINEINAILVTHEHMDHLKYAPNFAMNGVNVYASAGTFAKLELKGHRFKVIKALQQFTIKDFTILPFDVQHDAAEPLRIFNSI